ncbi:DoxX family membrane protein [Herbidospora mongoliensis]|uniref:DoxX family membrane protein n=1 Tax=Herbidospora mongoliensis TaxID=688067 RepID=UPI000830BA15|nr:DoxX family membrane protein [Herbidospora mongoliensis]
MATTHGRRTFNTTPLATPQAATPATRLVDQVWAVARIALGWIFLWAFVDKLFGFGFATPAAKSWINGGSPTTGFLKGAADGPLGGFYNALAGHALIDWLFMLGLLGVGVALIAGIGLRAAAVAGTLMMVMMWGASLPLDNNPFMDDHIVYAIVLIGLAATAAGDTWGLGRRWARLPIVQKYPILK